MALAGLEMSVKASEAREHLTRMFSGLGGGQVAGEAMYAASQTPEGGPDAAAGQEAKKDDVIDADFSEVDEKDQKKRA